MYKATSTSKIRCHYRYRVKSNVTGGCEVFQTVGNPISDEITYRVVSRANRVWLVRKVISDDGKTPVLSEETRILKDAWLYADVHLEKDIQDDIFERISKNLGKAAVEEARQYFLTIGVVSSGEGKDDITYAKRDSRLSLVDYSLLSIVHWVCPVWGR